MMGTSGSGSNAADSLIDLIKVIANPEEYQKALTALQDAKAEAEATIVKANDAMKAADDYVSLKKIELKKIEDDTNARIETSLNDLNKQQSALAQTSIELSDKKKDLEVRENRLSLSLDKIDAREKDVGQREAILKAEKLAFDEYRAAANVKVGQTLSDLDVRDKNLQIKETALQDAIKAFEAKRDALESILNAQKAAMSSLTDDK